MLFVDNANDRFSLKFDYYSALTSNASLINDTCEVVYEYDIINTPNFVYLNVTNYLPFMMTTCCSILLKQGYTSNHLFLMYSMYSTDITVLIIFDSLFVAY